MKHLEEKNKDSDSLIFFLHGYSTSMYDLFGLKDEIKSKNKLFSYISINAPYDCEFVAGGYQWFPLKKNPFPIKYSLDIESKTKDDLNHSSNLVIEFVEQKVKEYNVDYKNVYFFGFSQGTIMSFHIACRMKQEIGGIIACSGFIKEDKENEFKNSIISKPPVLFLYGDKDEFIEEECFDKSIEFLKNNNFNLTVKKYKNFGHTISSQEIKDINDYI